MGNEYLSCATLWRGAILGTIANATMTIVTPEYASFQSWDSSNYLIDGWDGRYGAITFEGPSLVGVFFDPKSDRNPHHHSETYDIESLFRGAPSYHRSLARRGALRYWNQVIAGEYAPCITAAFWNEGDFLTSADPWSVVYNNGGDLIRIQLIEDLNMALAEWKEAYQMTVEQVQFVRSLFEQRMTSARVPFLLTPAETTWLHSRAKCSSALKHCQDQLAAVGILMGNGDPGWKLHFPSS
jgi:hypothetical protein